MKQITSQTALDAYTEVVDEIHITLAMLENMPSGARACAPARRWFQEKFPDGGERAEVWNACPNWEWKVWFAVHSATTEEAVAFAQSCEERAVFYAVAAVAVAAKAAAAADAHAAAAYSAAHAAAAYAAEAADYAADAAAAAADADTYNAAEHADAAAEAAADAHAAAAEAEAAYEDAYAAAALAAADEIQAQVAWARGILFS